MSTTHPSGQSHPSSPADGRPPGLQLLSLVLSRVAQLPPFVGACKYKSTHEQTSALAQSVRLQQGRCSIATHHQHRGFGIPFPSCPFPPSLPARFPFPTPLRLAISVSPLPHRCRSALPCLAAQCGNAKPPVRVRLQHDGQHRSLEPGGDGHGRPPRGSGKAVRSPPASGHLCYPYLSGDRWCTWPLDNTPKSLAVTIVGVSCTFYDPDSGSLTMCRRFSLWLFGSLAGA